MTINVDGAVIIIDHHLLTIYRLRRGEKRRRSGERDREWREKCRGDGDNDRFRPRCGEIDRRR